MRIQLAPELIKKIKRLDVRIRKSFKQAIDLLSEDPNNSKLNNHKLQREWEGFRSIDVTVDLRALFREEKIEGDELVAYFVALGTHRELFRQDS